MVYKLLFVFFSLVGHALGLQSTSVEILSDGSLENDMPEVDEADGSRMALTSGPSPKIDEMMNFVLVVY